MWYFTSPEPLSFFEVVLALELGEQLGGRLAQHVDQHVEAAAVGHADHDLLDALRAAGWIRSSSSGIRLSPPSSEKRFCAE